MKKYAEIMQEIAEQSARMSTTYADELSAALEEYRASLVEFRRTPTVEERHALHAKIDALRASGKLEEEERENMRARLAVQILRDNAKHATAAEVLPVALEIWNKYAGKRYGEKTADKIRDEIRTACGCYVIFCDYYGGSTKIEIQRPGEPFSARVTLHQVPGGETPPTDADNKINALHGDAFSVSYLRAYVEDIPAHINALLKAHADAREAEKKADEARRIYRDLTRGAMDEGDPVRGVPVSII